MNKEQFETELPKAILIATRPVIRILGKWVKNGAIDDVIQNASLKAWKNLSKFREDSQFNTWFYKIAINEALMFLRFQERRFKMPHVTVSLDEILRKMEPVNNDPFDLSTQRKLVEFLKSPQPDPEEQAIKSEERSTLIEEIQKLPPTYRRGALKFATGMPIKNSAEKSARFNGRQRLRERVLARPEFKYAK